MVRGSKKQSELMIRAAQGGATQKQRAAENLQRQQESGQRYGLAAAQTFGNLTERGEQRKQQGKQFDASMEERQHQFDVTSDQRTRGQEFQEAQAGFERTDKPMSSREQRLAQQMDEGGKVGPMEPDAQERLKGQAEQQMQADGATGPYRQTEVGEQRMAIARSQTAASLMNAQANMVNAQANAARAMRLGGEKGTAAMVKATDGFESSIARVRDLQDKVLLDKVPGRDALQYFADNPDVEKYLKSEDPNNKQASAGRAAQLLRTVEGTMGLHKMASTGMAPDNWDPTNPVLKKFSEMAQTVQASMRSAEMASAAMGMGSPFGIQSVEEKNRFLRKTTANIILRQQEFQRMAPALGKDRQIAELGQRVQDLEAQMAAQGMQIPGQQVEKEDRYGRDESGQRATGPIPTITAEGAAQQGAEAERSQPGLPDRSPWTGTPGRATR